MAPAPPTVIAIKQDFLTSQTRLLSQPLAPTRAWRATNTNAEEGSLPEKAIDDALFKLNHQIAQHSRRVFAPQATRHVAEQIDQLYWNSAVAVTAEDEEGDDEGVGVGADLADEKMIATLPSAWDAVSPQQAEAYPLEAKRYAELVGRLQELSTQRGEAAVRMERLQRMKALLGPFEDVAAVQENLVTRNGEVEIELQRMRMLLARVGGRVGQLKDRGGGEGGDDKMVVDVEADEQRKVGQLLTKF
ncbi:kinetochore Sim4 complex subunit Fta4 [Podospora aff. communis PSN243]|uniref:Kinetochore Sim4 complex subunit Fta4 n=1 Tax=Podospora aff. communis PSN243 TaxID=3040156 RepID=A0AAV9GVU2_9PEZI|nr:kinetochore Sim4 complex subunit Fta4 [Podospora aff. communis PSN243]